MMEPQPRKNNSVLIAVLSVLGVLAILALMIGGWCIHENNSINTKYQAVKMQYGQVDTVLQRRYDLIPNLTNSVKGDMHNEQKIFSAIAKARSSFNEAKTAKEKFKANNELDRSTNLLINAIHENYPQLNSDKRVSDLMVELEGSENRISTERQNYNRLVNDYNTTITNFPGSLFAGGRSQLAYFEADKSAKKAPKVDLDN